RPCGDEAGEGRDDLREPLGADLEDVVDLLQAGERTQLTTTVQEPLRDPEADVSLAGDLDRGGDLRRGPGGVEEVEDLPRRRRGDLRGIEIDLGHRPTSCSARQEPAQHRDVRLPPERL